MRGFLLTEGDRFWLLRDDWREGKARASNVKELIAAWGAALGIGLFVSVFLVAVAVTSAPLFAHCIVGVFALGVAVLLGRAVLLTLRQLAYGTPVLYFQETPIVPGRAVPAVIRTRREGRPSTWTLKLKRTETKWQQTHSNGRTSNTRVTNTAFEQPAALAGAAKPADEGGLLIPVLVEVPVGEPAASVSDDVVTKWLLEVKSPWRPLRFCAVFELPVFYAGEDEIRQTNAAL
jgi:hypothetical protein